MESNPLTHIVPQRDLYISLPIKIFRTNGAAAIPETVLEHRPGSPERRHKGAEAARGRAAIVNIQIIQRGRLPNHEHDPCVRATVAAAAGLPAGSRTERVRLGVLEVWEATHFTDDAPVRLYRVLRVPGHAGRDLSDTLHELWAGGRPSVRLCRGIQQDTDKVPIRGPGMQLDNPSCRLRVARKRVRILNGKVPVLLGPRNAGKLRKPLRGLPAYPAPLRAVWSGYHARTGGPACRGVPSVLRLLPETQAGG